MPFVITKCPLIKSIDSYGDGFTIHDGGGILINESGTYMIAASIYSTAIRNNSFTGSIVHKSVHIMNQNNIELISSSDNVNVEDGNNGEHIFYGVVSTAPKIVNLSAGDILYLCGRISPINGVMYTGNIGTYLTIMRVW